MPFARTRRKRWGCSFGGALIVVWLVAAPLATGREPGRTTFREPQGARRIDTRSETGPPLQVAIAPPESVADPPTKFSAPEDFNQWHQNLVRERQVEVRLRSARKDLESGHLIEGLTELQSILDRDEDVFVRLESEPVPRGARSLAASLLASLPPQALAAYQTLFGSQASQLLDSGAGRVDPDLLARVVRRYYQTAAGFEAGQRLAAWWMDHGSNELAWGWWRRVLDDPVHRLRVTSTQRAHAACCAMRLGQPATARRILEDIDGATTVKLAGRSICISDTLAELVSVHARIGEFSGVRGHDPAECDPRAVGSPPALGHALWSGTLAGEKSRHLDVLAQAWESYQLHNGLPIGTSQLPLLVDQRLIYRDFEGLRAVDVRSGQTLWFYPCVSALCREISPRHTVPADGNPDPNNVMRLVVGNCAMQTLSTDSKHVFAIDRIEPEEQPATPASSASGEGAAPPGPACNVLAAFDLAAQGPLATSTWILGGREDGHGQVRELAGHCFLGPPLAVADRLFIISERRQQLYLSCLKSETGALVWMQVLCSVSQPIAADFQRVGMACTPTFAEGIVVCPTHAGVLVAVDSLSGTLLWAASHDDDEPQLRQQMSSWPYSARRKYAHQGNLNLPVIHGSYVLYLPAHSENVFCLDLATGCVNWRAHREDAEPSTATEYVAAVTDATAVLVGRRQCRGLAIDNGQVRWMVRLGRSPAGQGVRQGANYHVPLDDGRIVSLDLDSGRQTGSFHAAATSPDGPTASATGRPLGNLIADRDLIISMRPGGISVFRQAHVVLDDLDAKSRDNPHDSKTMLETAEIELTLGRLDRAELRLEEICRRSPGTSQALRAEELLRELLTRKLPDAGDRAHGVLKRLATLSAAPEYFGKYLLERCLAAHDRDDAPEVLAAARELATRTSDTLLAARDDPSRLAAGHVLAADLLTRSGCKAGPGRLVYDAQLAQSVAASVKSGDSMALRGLIDLFPDEGLAGAARLQLARLLADQGRFQQAEIVLLSCRRSPESRIAGESTRLLAELWNAQGLHHDAAGLFVELATQFASVEVAPQQLGSAWVAAFPRDSQTFASYDRLLGPPWSGAGATISEERRPNDALQTIYNGNGIQYLSTPRRSAFDLFDRGRGANGLFAVVNRHTGSEYPETIRVPGRIYYPATTQSGYAQHASIGNFFPLGGMGALYGISLLERKLLWTTVPKSLEAVKDVVRVGPAGPRFCTFQHRQHLFVVDPVDGHMLWHRDDLEATSGLMHEAFLGIICDERVLVVFASNNANYTVYDTASGAELRRGKLDIQHRLTRRAIGRRLFHYTALASSRRLRVWDPLDDSYAWDEPASGIAEVSVLEGVPPGTKVLAFVRDCDEAAYLSTSGQIRVVNLTTGKQQLSVALEPELLENASRLSAFRDRDCYFFNLQRSACQPKSAETHMISDAILPCLHIDGELCAVDGPTQQLLWRRSFGKRSILQLPDLALPVLVSIFRKQKQDQSCLSVELIDVRSGMTLASREDLLSDRLLQSACDRQGRSIELRGAKSIIRLAFPESVAHLNAGEPPR
jgi:outer membrane protein assembly factor BamB